VQWSPALTLSALPHSPALHPLSFSPIAFEGSNPADTNAVFSMYAFRHLLQIDVDGTSFFSGKQVVHGHASVVFMHVCMMKPFLSAADSAFDSLLSCWATF